MLRAWVLGEDVWLKLTSYGTLEGRVGWVPVRE